jgi:hypothetical protein
VIIIGDRVDHRLGDAGFTDARLTADDDHLTI